MALPSVPAEAIYAAMTQFDTAMREQPEWTNWTLNKSHKYAIRSNGHLYPVKQIVSMATGSPVSSFSGGSEANRYVHDRGFKIEPIQLPTESETRIALHELLLQRPTHAVSPLEAYEALAARFQLSTQLRSQEMENTRENHFENRVRQARRKLVDAGTVDGSEQGIWKLKVRNDPKVWVEKVLVENRPDRSEGDFSLGKALWSPKRSRADDDDYWAMRQVQPGDYVIHLIDNREVAGVSVVADFADMNFTGLPNTSWAGMDAYLIRLKDFRRCSPALERKQFLGNPAYGSALRAIRASHKHLFYDRELNLNQGFYLTPAPEELVSLLNKAYIDSSGHLLPHLERFQPGSGQPVISPAPGTESLDKGHTLKVWLYAPGRDAEHWDEFYRDGIIGIGWDELGDLSALETVEEVSEKIKELYERDHQPMNDARACYEFAHEMRPGDIVFAKRGRSRIVGYGTILGEYRYDPARDHYCHTRRIRWDARGEWTWTGEQMLAMKTLTDISRDQPLVSALRQLVSLDTAEDTPEVAPAEERSPYTLDDALDGLFIEPDELQRALDIWKLKKNLIIQGPPGVGKTFVAKRLAYALMGFKDASRLGTIQFHQSYSYEDFVQGYRPTAKGLELKDGLFLEFCRRAARDKDTDYVFIIDEINRGNLSRIFGELLMLIEADKRGSAWSVPLTYSPTAEEQFFVPENVYIIGLMNTADRSLAVVDYALRRRFAFWTLSPKIHSPKFRQMLVGSGLSSALADKLIACILKLNDEIKNDSNNLGPGYQVGHSFFCQAFSEEADPGSWLAGVISTELIPLVAEYWADDPVLSEKWSAELTSLVP